MVSVDGWLVSDPVRRKLRELEPVIQRAAATLDARAAPISTHLTSRGGKRFRPTLLFLAAEFGTVDDGPLVDAAAALELIHAASLYHDDVMDRAPIRRGAPSANSIWGNRLATVGGTLLFAEACWMLASLGEVPNRLASEASVRLSHGQLREVENAFDVELSTDDHLEILELKTATLFELPCALGCHLAAAAPAWAQGLRRYGRDLGIAFQLVDDALDLVGDRERMGKATLTDVREGVYSYGVLHCLGRGDEVSRELASLLRRDRLTSDEIRHVAGAVRRGGGVEAALRRAALHVEAAESSLAELPDGPARRSLVNLARFAIRRST